MQGCWCAGSRGWTRAGLNLSTSTSAWAAAGRIGKSLNIWRSCQPSVGRAGDGGLHSGWDASGRFLLSGNRVQPLENQAVGEECTTAIGKVKVEQWRVGSGCSLEIIYADRNSLGLFFGRAPLLRRKPKIVRHSRAVDSYNYELTYSVAKTRQLTTCIVVHEMLPDDATTEDATRERYTHEGGTTEPSVPNIGHTRTQGHTPPQTAAQAQGAHHLLSPQPHRRGTQRHDNREPCHATIHLHTRARAAA